MKPIRLTLVKAGKEGELLGQGWKKQTTIDEPRLSELVENYQNMGYEVYVIEHPAQAGGNGCNSCFSTDAAAGKVYGDIYIRQGGNARPLEDALF